MKRRTPYALMQAMALAMAQQGYAQTLPIGHQVTGGSATVTTPHVNLLEVHQTSDRAVLRWDSFNVDTDNSVRFIQPGSRAAALNIVDDRNVSMLAGSLTADGSVFLINPHGITITPTGSVNTGGAFIASTLSVSATDFMDGLEQFQFYGNGAAVSSAGAITARDVLLLGSSVKNSGSVLAPTGRVALGSALQATLDLSGDGFLQVLLPAEGGAGPLVENSGTILADGGLVQIKAATVRTALREAVNMPGSVRARSISGRDGAIVFHGGEGGSLAVSGSVDASPDAGAVNGGRVEMMGSVLDVDFSQTDVGARGNLHLVANNIEIHSSATSGGNITGIDESPINGSIGNLLRAGTNVTLQANNDIGWAGGLVITSDAELAPAANGRAGDLHLMAGRRIAMGGSFATLNGDWTLTANASPLVAAERDSGMAGISMYAYPQWAEFVGFTGNSGHLRLEILSGNDADSIQLPLAYRGAALTASIDPGISNYDDVDIRAMGDIEVSGDITLSGHLRSSPYYAGIATLSGNTVDWTTETTGGRLAGRQMRFIENDVTTRFGGGGTGSTAPGVDAVRLELGSSGTIARVYGDTEPDQAALGDLLLSVAAHNAVPDPGIPIGDILATGSIAISGPGVAADVGSGHQLTLSATAGIAFKNAGMGGDDGGGPGTAYWIDMSGNAPAGNTVALEITPRPLTANLLNSSYTYGSPEAVVSLTGLVNGDAVLPAGTLDGQSVVYEALSGGFGFDQRLSAGSHSFGLNGLSGAGAGNYSFDFSGLGSGTVDIAAKVLNYSSQATHSTYGTLPYLQSALSGVLSGDKVWGVGSLFDSGAPVPLSIRTDVGTYDSRTTGLRGEDADNYVLAATGNTDSTHTILSKTLNWEVADTSSVYGTLASPGVAQFDGVVAGDAITATVVVDTPEPLAFDTDVGDYTQRVTTIAGDDSGNYLLSPTGNLPGTLSITPKALNYAGGSYNFEYGSTGNVLPEPTLNGIVGADEVSVGADAAEITQLSGGTGVVYSDLAAGSYEVGLKTGNAFLEGADRHNYLVQSAGSTPVKVTIMPKTLNFAVGNASSTYGTLAAPDVALSGLVGSDMVSGELGLWQGGAAINLRARTPAGNYVVDVSSLSGHAAPNYRLADSGNTLGALHIDPRQLNWHLGTGSTVYGDMLSMPTHQYSLDGVLPSDSVLPTLAVLDDAALSTQPDAGSYDAVVTGLKGIDAGNYVLAADGNTQGTMKITKRPLTWQLGNTTSIYGSTPTFGSLTVGNLVPGDADPTAIIKAYTKAFFRDGIMYPSKVTAINDRTDVGNYTVRVNGFDDPNYMVADSGNQPGNLRIKPRPLRFITFDSSSTYGTLPNFSAAALKTGDKLSGDKVWLFGTGVYPSGWSYPTEVTERSPAGTYDIMPDGLTGADSSNYVLDWTNSSIGKLTINPKEISYSLNLRLRTEHGHITFGNGNSSSEYGRWRAYEEEGSWYRWDPSVTLNGALAADLNEGKLALDIDNPKVPVSSINAFSAGTYHWRGSHLIGAAANNYRLTTYGNSDASLTIRPLSVSATVRTVEETFDRVTYGDYTGVSPDVAVHGRNAEFFESHRDVWFAPVKLNVPGTGLVDGIPYRLPAGTYQYALADTPLLGSDAQNFTIDMNIREGLTVLRRRIARLPKDEVYLTYGQTLTPELLFDLEGVLPEDEVEGELRVQDLTLGFNRNPVGTYDRAWFTDRLSGADAGNYVFGDDYRVNPEAPTVVTIGRKNLMLDIDTSELDRFYGDPLTTLPVLNGVVAGDEALVRPVPYVDANGTLTSWVNGRRFDVGNYPYWVELGGQAAGNYRLLQADSGRGWTLNVAPRPLTASLQDRSTEYGSFAEMLSLDDVVPGENIRGKLVFTDLNGNLTDYSERSQAGIYNVLLQGLTGNKTSNYTLLNDGISAALTVEPKGLQLVEMPENQVLPYGSGINLAALDGVLFEDEVFGTGTRNGREASFLRREDGTIFDSRRPVGSIDYVVNGLDGADSGNYRLLDKYRRAETAVTISPKVLGFTNTTSEKSLEYGAGIWLATLDGIESGDDVNVLGYRDGNGIVVDPNEFHDLLDVRQDIGSYEYVLDRLWGDDSANYVLDPSADRVETTVEIAPRVLQYRVANVVGQYGNFRECREPNISCNGDIRNRNFERFADVEHTMRDNYLWIDDPQYDQGGYYLGGNPWIGGLELGDVTLEGLLPGDDVEADVHLLDFKGERGSLDDMPPPGQYFQVVSGLTGSRVDNYELAETGNVPGVLTITPRWLSWETSSAFFMPETGLVGEPGIPVLRNVPAGMDVRPQVQAVAPDGTVVTDWNEALQPGNYRFVVIGLTGEDAPLFRPLPLDAATSRHIIDRGFLRSLGLERLNSVGALSVFADSRLGMEGVNRVSVQLPQPPDVQPDSQPENEDFVQTPNDPDNVGNGEEERSTFGRDINLSFDDDLGTADDADTAGSQEDPDDDSGGPDVEFDGELQVGLESEQSAGEEIDVPGGQVSVSATNVSSALAEFGVTGVTLELSSQQRVEIRYESGPGFIMFGAETEAALAAQFGQDGVDLSAEARAGMYASTGAAGELLDGLDAIASMDYEVGASAKAVSNYTFEDGKVVMKNQVMAVAGASTSANGSVSSDAGTIRAGARVYSPGAVGVTYDVGAGFSGGVLKIDLTLGLGFGLGGLELDLGFELNLEDIGRAMWDGMSCGWLQDCSGPTAAEVAARGASLGGFERFRYLNNNTEWRRLANQDAYQKATETAQKNYDSAKRFYDSFVDMTATLERVVNEQQTLQEQFFRAVESDPESAIGMARRLAASRSGLIGEYGNYGGILAFYQRTLGVQLVVRNGKLNIE